MTPEQQQKINAALDSVVKNRRKKKAAKKIAHKPLPKMTDQQRKVYAKLRGLKICRHEALLSVGIDERKKPS